MAKSVEMARDYRERFDRLIRKAVVVGQRKIRPGLRSVLGLLFVVGGIFGFLPILGFWMIPVGLVLIALDFPPLRRRFMDWMRRRRVKRNNDRKLSGK